MRAKHIVATGLLAASSLVFAAPLSVVTFVLVKGLLVTLRYEELRSFTSARSRVTFRLAWRPETKASSGEAGSMRARQSSGHWPPAVCIR